MIVTAIKTDKITPRLLTLEQLVDKFVPRLAERSVLAITSKVVSLCEGNVVPMDKIDRDELIHAQTERYADLPHSRYPIIFTITQNTLIPNAGVDESNAAGMYVVWPPDPQAVANRVRAYVRQKFGVRECGVIITDSTARPLRWGMGGISLGFSGFKSLHDYRGQPDLFGRSFVVETGDISGGLSAAAVLVMGEGAEQTPLAVLSDLDFVEFQDQDPTAEELAALRVDPDDDLFRDFLGGVSWRPGGQASGNATTKLEPAPGEPPATSSS